MLKKVNNKVFFVVLIVAMALLGSVSFCALQWSYLVDCTLSISEVRIGIFQQKGINSYGTTMVDGDNYAGVTVFLKKQNANGTYSTVTAWENIDSEFAVVNEDFAVSSGTYKVVTSHKAYLPDDLENPVEIFHEETDPITVN